MIIFIIIILIFFLFLTIFLILTRHGDLPKTSLVDNDIQSVFAIAA